MPTFGQIVYVVIHNHQCSLVLQRLVTCNFDSHVHAYEVDFEDSFYIQKCNNLADFLALSFVRGFGKYSSSSFVVPRSEIIPKL